MIIYLSCKRLRQNNAGTEIYKAKRIESYLISKKIP